MVWIYFSRIITWKYLFVKMVWIFLKFEKNKFFLILEKWCKYIFYLENWCKEYLSRKMVLIFIKLGANDVNNHKSWENGKIIVPPFTMKKKGLSPFL